MRSRSIVRITLLLSVIALAMAGILSFHAVRVLNAASETLVHTKDVSLALEQTLSVIRDAETGQRGYVLTGRADYLQPYEEASATLTRKFDLLRSLLAFDPAASVRLADLSSLAQAKMTELSETIALEQKGNHAGAIAVVMSGRGKATMDAIRGEIEAMQAGEEKKLAVQLEAETKARDSMTRAVVLTTLLAIAILAVLVFVARKESESLRDSEERLATTLRSIGDAVVATDREGRVSLLNPIAEELMGWSSDQAQGRPLGDVFRIINEHTRAIVENPVSKVLREGGIVGLANHTILIRRDGSETPIEDSAAPIRDRHGEIIGVVLVFRDATAQRAAEKSLLDADRRKDEFLAVLAHELRNPLAPIRQAIQIARSRAVTEAQLRWSHDVIERQVTHMARLLDDLLDVSRITRGKLEVRKVPSELSSIVEAGIEMARPLIDQRHHTLKVDLTAQSCPLQADPLRLAQVVCNLLTNAAKYTHAHGEIRLSTRRDDDTSVLTVEDNGVGLSPESLSQIFQMFVQIGSPLDRTERGLGIGLALARGLVELHDGEIEAHSAGVGHGSQFILRLPLDTMHLSESDASLPSTSAAEPTVRRSIVVADDNRDAAESLSMLLQLSGHEVHTVHDGQRALEAIQRVRPDIALLDIGMPKLSGYEVARRVRESEAGKHTVLVAITGWGQNEDKDRARASGFDYHWVKPIESDTIVELCRTLPVRQVD